MNRKINIFIECFLCDRQFWIYGYRNEQNRVLSLVYTSLYFSYRRKIVNAY